MNKTEIKTTQDDIEALIAQSDRAEITNFCCRLRKDGDPILIITHLDPEGEWETDAHGFPYIASIELHSYLEKRIMEVYGKPTKRLMGFGIEQEITDG